MRIKAALALGLMMLALTGACGDDDSEGVASTGGDPSESAGAEGGDQSEDSFVAQAREYAQCMRDNGVEDYPDPEVDDDGNIMMQGMTGEGGDAEYTAAEEACEDKAPGTGEMAEMDAETLKVLREFSQCMRDNGITGYPDPDAEGAFTVDVGALGVSEEELAAADEKCAEILEDTFEMENS